MAKFNAITDFKNRYAGGTAVDDELTESAVEKMAKAYETAINSITAKMTAARSSVSYSSYAQQTQLLKQIAQELDELKKTAGENLAKAIEDIALFSAKTAGKDMEMLYGPMLKPETWHAKYAKDYAQQSFKDNYTHIAAQTDKMLMSSKTLLREESAKIFRLAAVEGLTRKQAYQRLKAEILEKQPDFAFIDKTGRKWSTKDYLTMLTRTAMSNTLNECYINSLTAEGHDLVKISRHQLPAGMGGAAIGSAIKASSKGSRGKGKGKGKGKTYVDACANWEGKVLSLTGATKGYPTLEQAKASGEVFHPRCRHRLLAYDPTADAVFKAVEEGKSDAEINEELGLEMPKPKEGIEAALAADLKGVNLKQVGPQQGSNEGGQYVDDATGRTFYLKYPKTEQHALNELLASKLYEAVGVESPKLRLVRMPDGRLAIASEWVEGATPLKQQPSKSQAKQLHKGFATDAWLANWDVVGTGYDNIAKQANGKVVRIDVGGSLLYRAQGGEKGSAWGTKVTELSTMRDAGKNIYAYNTFKDISPSALIASIKAVEKLDSQRLKEIIKESGFTGKTADDLHTTLVMRQADLRKQRLAITKAWNEEYRRTKESPQKQEPEHWAHKGYTKADVEAFEKHPLYKDLCSPSNIKRAMGYGLTEHEAIAVVMYTEGQYRSLNAKLRTLEGKESGVEHIDAFAKILNSGLHKLESISKTTVSSQDAKSDARTTDSTRPLKGYLSRYIQLRGDNLQKFKERWKPGETNHTWEFWSTSVNHDIFSGSNVELFIKPKSNRAYVNSVSQHTSECECVLPVHTRIKVVEVIELGDKTRFIMEDAD